jgi:hypothetical protein
MLLISLYNKMYAAEWISMDAYKSPEQLPKASGLVILGDQDINGVIFTGCLDVWPKTFPGIFRIQAMESCALFATVSFLDGAFGFQTGRSFKS